MTRNLRREKRRRAIEVLVQQQRDGRGTRVNPYEAAALSFKMERMAYQFTKEAMSINLFQSE